MVSLHSLPFNCDWKDDNWGVDDLNAIKAGTFDVNELVFGMVHCQFAIQGNGDVVICDVMLAATQDVEKAQSTKNARKFTAA